MISPTRSLVIKQQQRYHKITTTALLTYLPGNSSSILNRQQHYSSSSSSFSYKQQNISAIQPSSLSLSSSFLFSKESSSSCIFNNCKIRCYSTSSNDADNEDEVKKKNTNKLKAIRTTLKKFFLKVHPDLFYQYPDVKKTNDKSLRILQSFLEEIKNEKMTSKSYSLQFYYLDSDSAGANDQSQIPHVSISFEIDSSTPRKLQTLLRNAEKQLQYLLKKIGIKDDLILNYLNDKESHEPFEPSDSLLAFVRENSHMARELTKIKVDLERSLDIMFTYFFMEHKIRVIFSDFDEKDKSEFTIEKKKQTLRQLEHVLHTLSPRIADDQLVHKIFYEDRIAEMEKNFKKQSVRYGENQEDEDDDEDLEEYNQQYQQRKQKEKEDLKHQQTLHKSGFGYRVKQQEQREKEKQSKKKNEQNNSSTIPPEESSPKEPPKPIYEPMGLSKDKNSWKGWDKIKAGFVTPETTEKSDDCHISLRLEGMTIVFTNNNHGIDLEGRVMLDIDKPDQWSQQLESVKPSLVVNNIRKCRERKNLEREVSEMLGVGFVYTDYSQQNTPTYLEYLQKIKSSPKEDFVGRETVYKDINIRIRLLDKELQQEDSNQDDEVYNSFTVDEKHGVLNIPIHSRVPDICKFIDSEANFLIREYQRHQNNIRNLNQLELTVKRQFRLMKLTKHADISYLDMVSCCRRLLNNQEPFLPFLFNVKVVIGKENQVGQDGQITIKWDFEL